MAVNPGLMSVAPQESERVIADRLNVGQLEITALGEPNGTFMTLAVRARAKPAQELVWVDASVSVCPIDLHHASSARRTQLDRLRGVTHEMRPSHLPDPAAVRSRTETVAWLASSSASASWISLRSRSGQGCSGSSVVA